MTTTCLISNFNYARFVGEAIDGALRQTAPFDQIVVVDDGSTDGSLDLLMNNYGQHPLIQILSKSNQGQLSCFNLGFAHATGDVVFFLDADDVYEPDYVQKALDVYRQHASCDFLTCGRRLFGQQDRILLTFPEDRDLGYSVIQTAYTRSWIGAATSCLSMRRSLLQKILPLPFVDQWRVRADDCLVFGSSLAGARKRFLAQPLVRYRVHGKNQYRGQRIDEVETYRRRLAINRLFEHFERNLCFNTGELADFSHREFRTLERPAFSQLWSYIRISMRARTSIIRRISCIADMIKYYLGTAWQHTVSTSAESLDSQHNLGIPPLRLSELNDAASAVEATHRHHSHPRAA
jgi:glycosyltransferase involved in cell wall biosynthesis